MSGFKPILTGHEFQAVVESLQDKRFPLLAHGYISLQAASGGDREIVRAARTTSALQAKTPLDDITLTRYLMRHRHGTPLEFAQVTIEVVIPMDAWRQWIRHRMASVNEYSTRYSDAIELTDTTKEDAWRAQSTANRQGSSGLITEWPEGWTYDPAENKVTFPDGGYLTTSEADLSTPGKFLSHEELELQAHARQVYERRLAMGVANEQARKDLPLSTYTKAWWTTDLRNVYHFLGLRMDPHAQKEIRDYATTFGEEIIAKLFPCSYEAFRQYELDSMRLSSLDVDVLRKVLAETFDKVELSHQVIMDNVPEGWGGLRCREREEFTAKLAKLGFQITD